MGENRTSSVLPGTLGTNTSGTGIGLVTNADEDLRLAPAERSRQQGMDDNVNVIDQTREVARFESLDRDAALSYTPEILAPDTPWVEKKDEDGDMVRRVEAIIPSVLLNMDWRGVTIRPTAWKLDPSWPFTVRPVGINENGWGSILAGYHCLKCLSWHGEQWPGVCQHCRVTTDQHRAALVLMESRGEIVHQDSTAARLKKLGLSLVSG